ncbi:hypothetical protein [Insolitispirillum peregrinum]|uniref:hypothetical protein n=1 Tax=Insolitispirillum peregrinum TaxID=80876 RepID=UPI0036222572
MAGFEEARLIAGMRAPLDVRCELRQMFERWLPRSRQPRSPALQNDVVDELAILHLCQYYRLEYRGGADDLAAVWDQSAERIADGGPTFDDLKREGWVFWDGSRWAMQDAHYRTLPHITYPSPSTEIFLSSLRRIRLVATADTPPRDVQALADRILTNNWLNRQIPIKDPEWLAGRLWERLCPRPRPRSADNDERSMQDKICAENDDNSSSVMLDADTKAVDRAFLEWSAWCEILGCVCCWDIGWEDVERRYCREAACRAVARQELWGNWDNDIARYGDVLEKTFSISGDFLGYIRTPWMVAPRTLVSRSDWLKGPMVEPVMFGRYGMSAVNFAFSLLCSELEKTDFGPGIMAAAATVISFAADHPMAFERLLSRVGVNPALLVDMLMDAQTASLAVKLVIEWQPTYWKNTGRTMGRDAQTKAFAVQDALSLLTYHLNEGTLDLEECASLVTWCHADRLGTKRSVEEARRSIGRQILECVAKKDEKVQSAVLRYLAEQVAYQGNVPLAFFMGILNGLDCLPDADIVHASPIVTLYLKFARNLNLESTDVSSLPAKLASRLVATAFAQAVPERDELLMPFDSAALLRDTPDDERISLSFSVARTLRVHARLLARAVAGWPDGTVPTELCDALQMLVSRSVTEHAEKGRVGALTDRHNRSHISAHEEGSPAQDLAAAWRRLDGDHQNTMLQVLAQSDDPVLLSQLCQYLPAVVKVGIQNRLRQLKPEEASTLWTWPELQRRIESFLDAGEYGLAREHLDNAKEALERVRSEVRLIFFSLTLRLLLKEESWAVLDSVVIPSGLVVWAVREAQDKLAFYKATSQLLRPDGNLGEAQRVLQRLAAQPGAAFEYKENWFAVAIQQLLGPVRQPLSGADKVAGERLLGEISAVIAAEKQRDRKSLLVNRALLLLALQRPDEALASIVECRRKERSANLEMVVVLAKSEMGLRDEAMAILDAALAEYGDDERLTALKKDLSADEVLPSIVSVSGVADPIPSIQAALQQLIRLLPSQVGELLGPPGGGLPGYLIREVSCAVAELQRMAPILRDRNDPNNEAKFEDDLNTAVRALLRASFAVVQWNVCDQSLGGVTVKGNPGERDIVIRASGQEIAVYEALVCSSINKVKIRDHFHKLINYGLCGIYFHVIYSYSMDFSGLFYYVRCMLEHEVPAGLEFIGCDPLGSPDYETNGYLATYRDGHNEVAVAFLIVNLAWPQRSAAETAALTEASSP